MGMLDDIPNQEQLEELNCDSYEEYTEPEESDDAKKIRVFSMLVASPDISTVDFEGITFTDQEIGDIIVARCFGGNPHGQTALQAKTSAYLLSVMEWNPNAQIFEEIQAKKARINEVRTKFNLNPL